MTNPKRKFTGFRSLIFIFLIISGIQIQGKAQQPDKPASPETKSNTEDGSFPRRIIRIDPVRFLIREPNIGIEWRNSNRHSSEIRIGYIYPQPAMMWLYETFIPMTTGKYQGPSLAYQHRFWHSEKASYFLLSAQYRYLWHTNQWMYLGGLSGSGFDDVLLSQWRNDLIVKLAWSPNASYQKRIHFEVGLGVQLSQQYSRATACTSCGTTTLSYEAQLEQSLEPLLPNDGLFIRPWLHFSFSMPIFLSKKEKSLFR